MTHAARQGTYSSEPPLTTDRHRSPSNEDLRQCDCLSKTQQVEKNSTWWSYVQQVAPGDTPAMIADRVDVDRSAITRWKSGSGVDPRFAAKFARVYGRPVTEALVACGLIHESEAGINVTRAHAGDLTNKELIAELERRLAKT